jgi:hypothetical protein
VRDGGGLDPAADAQLGQDVGHVDARGLCADVQRLRDLGIGPARREQLQDFALPVGEPEPGEFVRLL